MYIYCASALNSRGAIFVCGECCFCAPVTPQVFLRQRTKIQVDGCKAESSSFNKISPKVWIYRNKTLSLQAITEVIHLNSKYYGKEQ